LATGSQGELRVAAQLDNDLARSDRTAGPSTGSRQNITSWCRRHTANGDAAVAAQRRVGTAGPRPLTIQQELDLVALLRSRFPDQDNLPGQLWTRPAVTAVAHQHLGLRLTGRQLARCLKSWGLGPRHPSERACPLCVYAVRRWLAHDYPLLLREARTRGAQVCWAGRTRLGGVVPNAEVVSAVTSRGGLRFLISPGRDAGPLSTDFLTRLTAHEDRPVDVMVDGSWAIADWPRNPPDGVRLHPMPSCDRADA
jgi:transposase